MPRQRGKRLVAFPGNEKKRTPMLLIAPIHWSPLEQMQMGVKHGGIRHSFGGTPGTEQQLKSHLAWREKICPAEKPLRSSCFPVPSSLHALVVLVA